MSEGLARFDPDRDLVAVFLDGRKYVVDRERNVWLKFERLGRDVERTVLVDSDAWYAALRLVDFSVESTRRAPRYEATRVVRVPGGEGTREETLRFDDLKEAKGFARPDGGPVEVVVGQVRDCAVDDVVFSTEDAGFSPRG